MSITFYVEDENRTFTPTCPRCGVLGEATPSQAQAERIAYAHYSNECRYSNVREAKPQGTFSLDYNQAERLLADLTVSSNVSSGSVRYEALERTLRSFRPREGYQVEAVEQLQTLIQQAAKTTGWVLWSEVTPW